MKAVLTLLSLSSLLFAGFEYEGYVGAKAQSYKKRNAKHSTNISFLQQLKLSYEKDAWQTKATLYAQEDNTDLNHQSNNERTFIRLDELFLSYEFDNAKLLAGKNIRFWGALEAENITDVFNLQEGRNEAFSTDKEGAYNLSYSYYTEDGELFVITKFHEQNLRLANSAYAYSPLISAQNYNEHLQSEKNLNRPTLYVGYNASLSQEYSLDYALIAQHGFDSQRYFSTRNNELFQNAYLVNKLLSYNTLLVNATLYKLEALYTDVIDDANIADYFQVAFGIEHTLEPLENGAELGFISEYYYYQNLENNKLNDLNLNQNFQNDLFLGMRYAFNDANDAEAVGGVIIDTEYDEQSYYIEYEGRLMDGLKLEADYRYINPSKSHNTTYASLGTHHRISLALSYYF